MKKLRRFLLNFLFGVSIALMVVLLVAALARFIGDSSVKKAQDDLIARVFHAGVTRVESAAPEGGFSNLNSNYVRKRVEIKMPEPTVSESLNGGIYLAPGLEGWIQIRPHWDSGIDNSYIPYGLEHP